MIVDLAQLIAGTKQLQCSLDQALTLIYYETADETFAEYATEENKKYWQDKGVFIKNTLFLSDEGHNVFRTLVGIPEKITEDQLRKEFRDF